MGKNIFKAMVVRETEGKFICNIENKSVDELPAGDVLINVKYSSLNYKDALSAVGNKGITKKYPHTPGIDAAGIVISSKDGKFKEGDEVIVTGFDLGVNTSGGFGQFIRVPAGWLIKLPNGISLKESMIYGTAGFTAALSLYQLEHLGLEPSDDEILVTGATGGVGSIAVSLLNRVGFKVVAATGKMHKSDYLKKLGARFVLSREEVDDLSGKSLLPTKWGGVIDSVGGNILATAVKSTKYFCSVASCGLTQSPILNTTVYPFILRGVNLLGIDSAHCSIELRKKIWQKLSTDWKLNNLNLISSECSPAGINQKIDLILKGQLTGRILINLNKE